jgi:hypothetical protein
MKRILKGRSLKDGSGSGLERISADFGTWIVGLVQIFTHGFANLDIHNC